MTHSVTTNGGVMPSRQKIKDIVFFGVMTALIIFMTMTGLAYIPINAIFKMTLLTVPVAIGSVVTGVRGGLYLGTVFGLSSFATCFGLDALGAVLLGINPFLTFITCVVPRVLCGVIPALIYKYTSKYFFGVSLACVLTAVLNTLLFLGTMWLFFGNAFIHNETLVALIKGVTGNPDFVISGITVLFATFAGTNAIIEAATGLVVGTAACRIIMKIWKRGTAAQNG